MRDMSDDQANELKGGSANCGYNIVVSATIGGVFGGAGSVVGAVVAATGPSCLGWW